MRRSHNPKSNQGANILICPPNTFHEHDYLNLALLKKNTNSQPRIPSLHTLHFTVLFLQFTLSPADCVVGVWAARLRHPRPLVRLKRVQELAYRINIPLPPSARCQVWFDIRKVRAARTCIRDL